MKYPSTVLRELADKVDGWEDRLLERDLDFWNWPRLRSEVVALREQQKVLLSQYAHLVLRYEEEAGKKWRIPSVFSMHWGVTGMMVDAVKDAKRRERKEAS